MTRSHLEQRANLAGRIAIVTGAAGGIGQGITLDFARAGMDVLVCDSDRAALKRLTDELSPLLQPRLEQAIDVRDQDQLDGFFDAVDRLGCGVDVLVNVVGGSFQSEFLATNRRGWDALARQNLDHVLAATHLAATRMVAQGRGGSVINITSIEAHRAAPSWAVYAAFKWAVEGFSRSLAAELGPDNVRVNCIAPDYVLTPGTELIERAHGSAPMTDAEAAAIVPMGRLATPAEVAGCALFLASDLASFVTGTTVHPDGGALAAGRWMRFNGDWTPRLPPEALPSRTEPS